MSEENAVATIPNAKAPIVLGVTKQALTALKKKYPASKVPDASTKEGYQAIVEARRVLVPLRTGVEKEAKIQKEAAQTHLNNINKVKNTIIETIRAIEKPWYEARKNQDEKIENEKREAEQVEDRRIADIESKVDDIQALTQDLLGADVATLEARLAEAGAITITDAEYMEFIEPASLVLSQAKEQLTNAVTMAKGLAAQQKEVDAQAAKMAEKQRLMDEQMAEKQRVMDEQMAAQQEVLDAQAKELADKEAAIKSEEDRKEAERIAVEREAAEEKTRKEDEAHDLKMKYEKAEELAARMPEDQKMRAYVDELLEVKAPDVESLEMVAVLREVSVNLSDIVDYVVNNTQST